MSSSNGDVAGAYDRWAGVYDADQNATRDLDAAVLRREAPAAASGDVLEVGCGTGKNTAWLAGRARSVIALDFSGGMLAKARERVTAPNVRWLHHDLRHPWPVEPRSLDLVLINLVLEHVRDVAPVFSEAARVLRPGGSLFLCELHPERQRRGGQAQFTDPASGQREYVEAFLHSTSELVNAALDAGLVLHRMGEWVEDGGVIPRLLSLHMTA
jgi:ubiquinone/menaquinone biosynthesis C-methylase UbiE